MSTPSLRHDWSIDEVREIMNQSFNDLIFKAQSIHREHFDPNEVQISTLCNIKTGGCAEDCSYCSQSSRYDTGLEKEHMMAVEEVVEQAKAAKAAGASRFCMGAAWRNPNKKDFAKVVDMIKAVKDLDMEVCTTLGMLTPEQAKELSGAGLDYYNHN